MRYLLALLMGLVLGPARVFAASAGAEPFNFLFLDANAKPVGMGGAYTALATDANALLYNPAGLGRIKSYEATFMHNQHFAGMSQEYMAVAAPQGWGLNLNYFNSGDVARTTVANPDGTGLGNTSASDLALSGGYGLPINESLAVGAAGKFIREANAGTVGSGYALDLGALYTVPRLKGLSLGAAVQNIGPSVKFQSAKENLPLNVRGGAAYRFKLGQQESAVSMDISRERSEEALVSLGAETVLAKMMPLRLGFNTRNKAGIGITAGVGWNYGPVSLDYAFMPYGALGMANRFSVTWRWGEPRTAEQVRDRSPLPVLRAGQVLTPEQYFARAEILMRVGSLAEAGENLDLAAKNLKPEDGRWVAYYEMKGRLAWLENNVPKAKAAFEEGLRLAAKRGFNMPSVADSYVGMGLCLVKQGEDAAAMRYFSKALELGPSDPARRQVQDELRRMGQAAAGKGR